MNRRKVRFKEGDYIKKCPKCGNNTDFTVKSDYCAEDCCEIWVECKCGYDPTSEKHSLRLEDVWGGVDDDNCRYAIEVSWNDAIEELKLKQQQ
jgi:hypothetical protein